MNVELKPFSREEYHAFYQNYEADPMMDPLPYRYQYTHVDRSFDYDQTRREWYPTFGIFADGKAVGILSLKRIDREKKRCEIGLVLMNDSVKNKGYGTQAMRLGMKLAVEQYGVNAVWADTMGCNTRMQHILEKLSFRLVERVPQICDMIDHKEDWLNYVWEEQA